MKDEAIKQIIKTGREFMKLPANLDDFVEQENYHTDQELKKPQPPLYKARIGSKVIELPKNYTDLVLKNDILEVLYKRKSSRVYTEEPMSLLELAYLLWATQGVKEIRGNNYATIRTVACGGARHEFECYLVVNNVAGLEKGYYHYMPDIHALELIELKDDFQEQVNISLCNQTWANKANVIFYYSVVPYRAEWRYGIWTHRTALIDAGHITQNLYVACSSLNLGTCAIASVETAPSNQMFQLDGEEEFIFYAAPVGTISDDNKNEEAAFYAFLKEE